MKKYCFILLLLFLAVVETRSQENDASGSVKLFLDCGLVAQENNTIETNLQERLCRKITELINQSGVVETGYSTFLVAPKFDIISVSESQGGISSVFLAECELGISIKRAAFGSFGEATFNSFSLRVMGSGTSRKDAIANAVTNISSNGTAITNFLQQSRQKIFAYFNNNCNDVLKEALQAKELRQYAKAIALYFSIPIKAPCFKEAMERSKGVYAMYEEDKCSGQLLRLKSYVSYALTENTAGKNYYDSALNIMKEISPGSNRCFDEAKMQIAKIETRLTEEQKESWALRKKLLLSQPEIEKERYKAMARISSSYQPTPTMNVILAH